MDDLIFYTHSDCLLKENGLNHPERKERLETIINSINQIVDIKITKKYSPLADLEVINYVQPLKYVENMFSKIPISGLSQIEDEPYADTFLCHNSKNAILRSCGAGIAAVDDLMINNERVFCAVRPPGHHAETKRANGFCFINNIAVAARFLQKNIKLKK